MDGLMTDNTVSLCMIVKNEVNNLESLLSVVCYDLEQIVIVDTGSTDGTIELIKSYQKNHPNLELHHKEWNDNFSDARNYSFSLATQSWIFWLDGDDWVDNEELIEFKNSALKSENVDCWILDYDYAQLPSGESALTLGRERFIRRDMNPKWIGAIHETVDISNMRTRHYPDFTIHHDRSNKVIDPNRNVTILEKEYNKENPSPRTIYYYGKELFDRINPKGIGVLEEFTRLGNYYWDDMVNACARLGRHYLSVGQYNDAIDMAFRIYKEDGSRQRAEGYWILGRAEQFQKNYSEAIKWYERCFTCNPGPPRVLDKEYYTWNPHVRICECLIAEDRIAEAISRLPIIKSFVGGEGEDYIRLLNSLRNTINPVNGLLIAEFGEKTRRDSYDGSILEILYDGELDGLLINDLDQAKWSTKLKPGAFLWVKDLGVVPGLEADMQFLVNTEYNSVPVSCFIKRDNDKDSYSFPSLSDDDFGPYRIRIKNAKMSAIKAGFPVVSHLDSDYHYSASLKHQSGNNVNILDICEELPSYDYAGLEKADRIVVSSDLLKDHLERMTDKPISVIEDHFEMTEKEWL